MAMIGPLPVSPAAPTPWRVDDVFPRRVSDAKGEPLFSVDGLALTHDQDAALARELVDLVNRAAAVGPETRPAERTDQASPETSTVCLPATVETRDGDTEFEVYRQSPPGFAEIRVITDFGSLLYSFDPSSARTLAYALLAAADPEPVEGPAEPDPGNPSTWRRYVDEVGDVWFEFAPGRVGCGSRGYLGRFVSDKLSRGRAPETFGEALDDARDWFGLRRA